MLATQATVNAMEVDIDRDVSSIIALRQPTDQACGLLRKVLDAFTRLDSTAALDILREDVQIDQEFDGFVRQLITYMMEDPRMIPSRLVLLFDAKAIERDGDHAQDFFRISITSASST